MGGCTKAEVGGLGSHSLKATTLSWGAEYSLPAEQRKLLGYHTAADDVSMLTYSRDSMSGPLRALERMVEAIRLGEPDPDATRSGRFHPGAAEPDAVASPESEESEEKPYDGWELVRGPDPVEIGRTGPESEDDGFGPGSQASEASILPTIGPAQPPPVARIISSSSSSTSSSDEAADGDEEGLADEAADKVAEAQGTKRQKLPPEAEGAALFRSARFRTFHLRRQGEMTKLICGQVIHAGYELVREMPAFCWPRCSQCFGTPDATDRAGAASSSGG